MMMEYSYKYLWKLRLPNNWMPATIKVPSLAAWCRPKFMHAPRDIAMRTDCINNTDSWIGWDSLCNRIMWTMCTQILETSHEFIARIIVRMQVNFKIAWYVFVPTIFQKMAFSTGNTNLEKQAKKKISQHHTNVKRENFSICYSHLSKENKMGRNREREKEKKKIVAIFFRVLFSKLLQYVHFETRAQSRVHTSMHLMCMCRYEIVIPLTGTHFFHDANVVASVQVQSGCAVAFLFSWKVFNAIWSAHTHTKYH